MADPSLPGPSRPSHPNISHVPSSPHHAHAPPDMTTLPDDDYAESVIDVIPSRAGRKLCVRHKQMANQNIYQKLQKSLDNLPTSERSAVTHLWSTFSNAQHAKRKLILEGILTMCCFSQLSHLSDSLDQIIRIDPISLLPREVNMRILGYLDAISLGRAAQVSKSWKALADDDLLWRRMCGQHIDRKCETCGWGLPLLERKRLKVELKDRSPAAAVGVGGHDDHAHGHGHGPNKLVTRVEALRGKIPGLKASIRRDPAVPAANAGVKRFAPSSPEVSATTKKAKLERCDSDSDTTLLPGNLTRQVRMTRPWKTVYCERLVVERNWRKGRCTTRTLKGHTDGVMCLQYHTSLTNPSYPVLITGSYDRTVRVWNLDTAEEVRVLRGHTRAVRALQFDQMLLFTGAMDGTVRMWNWRAGECLRVLEGHTDGVISLNYNGYLLASGSADSTIRVWNFRTGNKFVLHGHDEWVNSVVLWDGKTSPGDIDPAQMPSFTRHRTFCSPAPGTTAETDKPQEPEIDPEAMLFSASDDGTVKLWDLLAQTCIRTFEGHKAQIQSLRVIVVDMSEKEIAAVQSQVTRNTPTPPRRSYFAPASTITLSPSPPGSADGTGSESMQVLNAPDGYDPNAYRTHLRGQAVGPKVYVHSSTDKQGPSSDDSSGKGTFKKAILATGSLDGTVKLWDVESGAERSTLFGHIEGVWSVDIDALRLASASHDRTIKVWDRGSGNCEQTLVGHRGAVTSLQLSDDMIVSGSDDGDVMIWNFAPTASNGKESRLTALD